LRLLLLAVGRLKNGPERELVERYRERAGQISGGCGFSGPDIVEIPEGRERSAPERRRSEAGAILARTGDAATVAFDETGTNLSSRDFAGRLAGWRDEGRAGAAFVIGGPDGLADEVRSRAGLVLSFGRLTLPHQIVRALVCEQIYRALTINSGHPYHRGD
jgi:23S rRNA (pseudouridine1915-N3)-methyltransferase